MIKPQALKIGDTVGVIAPASPATEEKREVAKKALEELGFQVKMGQSCYSKRGYLAGSDALRAHDVNTMFADPEVKGIFCLRGGYGGGRILDRLDYELIRKNPKVFVGYSDITVIHIALNQKSDLITFHGPMAASNMVGDFDPYSREYLFRAVTFPKPMNTVFNPENEEIKTLVGGKAQGQITGGNLALIVSTLGTSYEIETKGKLLFLEDIDEKPYRVDRMLTQLLLAGKLREAGGFIIGDWQNCEADNPAESLTLQEVFEDILVPLGKPTLYNVKAGHCRPQLTLPLGVEGFIDGDEGKLVIKESATR